MSIDIRKDLRDVITRSGYSQSQVAAELHMSKSNITNWLTGDRDIPLNRLLDVMNYLDDDLFRYQVAEYLCGLKLLSPDEVSIDIPQTRFIETSKEEAERKALDDKVMLIFNKPASEVTKQDIHDVQFYLQQLSEETDSQTSMQVSIHNLIRQWIMDRPQGGVAYGS
ncbi:helix-turn-helix domain-containing protein [Lentilactobacillus sp. G22-6]|uniref:helix-turn-helix domain-containing protein n=1 Tax=Lentilactobacillus dabitei TaxID=2831523 RepID=UPI001C25FD29|nr:helix-turn-helix transcriptional regulator [Lentilactobacillus dabitei]MBU9788587.1 helix-turn-helix domain-containing protein [Lentilactobacillus dabitei]